MSYSCNHNTYNKCQNKYSCWIPEYKSVPQPPPPVLTLRSLEIIVTSFIGDETFTLNISPPAGGISTVPLKTVDGVASVIIKNVTPGTYTITEGALDGWTVVRNPQTVTIGPTDATVTFTNIFYIKQSTLTIEKNTSGGDGTFTFDISPAAAGITSTTITTVGGIGSETILDVNTGEYTITEVVPEGWNVIKNPQTVIVGFTVIPNNRPSVSFTNVALS